MHSRNYSAEKNISRTSERKLALFGGPKTFDFPLHVGRPNIGDRGSFQSKVDAMFDARWLSNDGPLLKEFESRICDFLGVSHCIAVCNGTSALMLAIRALGLKGEVIVPSFTFVATAHALQWQEIEPVFCDVDPFTHNICVESAKQLVTDRTTGIIGVHLWGRPCDTAALEQLAAQRRLKLLFDASHAFACSHEGKWLGNFGDAEVFSFHATKFLNSFEGGAVVTNNGELAAKLRLIRNFGFTGYDSVEHLGINAKMTEVCAAMGLTNLESMEHFIERNRWNHATYTRCLAGIPGIECMPYHSLRANYQYIILSVDPQRCQLTRDQLIEVLHAENILARRYFYPGCHRMEPYRSLYPTSGPRLANTEKLSQQILALPTGTAVGTQEIEAIADVIKRAIHSATRFSEPLKNNGEPSLDNRDEV